jgi:cytochrome c oxidase accessory protein FixG
MRRSINTVLQAILFATPWLTWQGHQAILFDIGARRFHLFGWAFWPQELYFLHLILIMAALTLFVSTAIGGRMWCGYACPQTLMTESFVTVERWLEGDRAARMRLDRAPWNADKFWRKGLKYGIWAGMALWLGITFVGYFTPIRSIVRDPWGVAGPVLFFAGAAFFDFGWFREQMCHYVCPYARFQGSMFDQDTLIVGYDTRRGEPRGKVSKADAGDCIDCKLCVQVCPMGIDIRNGLQMECIACTACVDACDSMMDKVGRPRGLVRYSSLRALQQGSTQLIRPRVVVYGLLLLALAGLFVTLLARRPLVTCEVVGGNVFSRAQNDEIANVYKLKLINKDGISHHVRLEAVGAQLLTARNPIELPGDEAQDIQILLTRPASGLPPISHVQVVTTDVESGTRSVQETSFVGPGL